MDSLQGPLIALAAVVAAAASTGAACRWWYGRQLRALRARIDKLERARQLASQHYAQAKNQIDQLQKDLVAAHKTRAETRSAARAEVQARRQVLVETLVAGDRVTIGEAAHGFADTQPAR